MPTEPRSVTRQGQDRKAELLRHAEDLFVEHGYAGTRMIDIADAAGVTKSLLYWYFETKEALLDEIAIDTRRRLRRWQSKAMGDVADPLARLYLATAATVRFNAEHHRLYRMIHNLVRDDPRLRATQAQTRRVMTDDVAALLAEGQDRGVVRHDDDPAALAHANAGAVYHFVLLHSDGDLDLDDVAYAAARYVVHAVAADSGLAQAVIDAHGAGRRLHIGSGSALRDPR
ncbi:MAG: TetR/AcrR family transcriptional regulator [Acidimicrobiales bacterium]